MCECIRELPHYWDTLCMLLNTHYHHQDDEQQVRMYVLNIDPALTGRFLGGVSSFSLK